MKKAIRKEIKNKRDSYHLSFGRSHSLMIVERLLGLKEFNEASCVLLYYSTGSEVQTQDLINNALLMGKRVVLPKTLAEENRLILYEIHSQNDLVLGAFSIMEPDPEKCMIVDPKEIDLVLVPGISFDFRGHRVGYGLGYYDKLLNKIKCTKLGLAYSIQLVEKIPNEPHDCAVDIIITENGVIECKKNILDDRKTNESSILKVVVLASGNGTDFQSLIDAVKNKILVAKIIALITDNPNANAINRAKENDIPVFIITSDSRKELDLKIKERLDMLSPDLVVLAGYMKIIRSKDLLDSYHGRLINIHPSLLPKYPGSHAQKDAFEAGEKISGFTIHFVDSSLDGGPIIYQEKVDISDCKTWESAAKKILEHEHIGLPKVVLMFARGKFLISGDKVNYTENL